MNYRTSADGVHWSDPHWRSGHCGDRTAVFYNPFRKKHVFLIRAKANNSGRAKRYWETGDINDPATVQWPGEGTNKALTPLWVKADLGRDFTRPEISDAPQLYHLDAMAYESVIVGLFAVHRGRFALRSDGRPVQPGRPKCNELMVGYSRDGFHWHRPEHETFLGVSEQRGSWRWGNVQPVGSLGLVVGDHIYFYVSARQGDPELKKTTEWLHDANASTGLAVMRRDGFASMDADGDSGVLTTRPVQFTGKHLFVNIDAQQGELRVEVLDRQGKAIAPYTLAKCNPTNANDTIHEVTWEGAKDLSSLRGRQVRFRFHLTRGSLYSFWVAPSPQGASGGYVLGGGPGFTDHADTVGRGAYPANRPPNASAGSYQTVRDSDGDDRQIVTLNAAGSVDNDGAIDRYTWFIEGRKIAAGATAKPELSVGTHKITLSVEDNQGALGFDETTVSVLPAMDPPLPQNTLVMWLKADSITQLEDDSPVSRWNDSSPNNFFASQEKMSLQPRWIAQAIGGRPAVRFDGEDDTLMVDYCKGLLYAYYNSTLFAVVQTKKGGCVVSHGHTNMSVSSHDRGTLSYSSAYQQWPSGDHVWPGVRSRQPGAVSLGQPSLIAMRRSSDKKRGVALFSNGQRVDDGVAIGYHTMNASNAHLGAGYRGKRNFWQGDIAELILYGRDLTDEEFQSVQKYLRNKYNLRSK